MLFPGPLRPLIDNREHLRDNLVWLEGTHNFELFYKVGTCTPPLALNGATKIERIALRRRVLPKLYHSLPSDGIRSLDFSETYFRLGAAGDLRSCYKKL